MIKEIDCGNSVVLRPTVIWVCNWIYKHLRFYDRRMLNIIGLNDRYYLMYSKAWTVWYGQDIYLGMIGFLTPWNCDNEALLAGVTTENIWKHKKLFVQMSPIILSKVFEQLPDDVHKICAMPTLEYVGAIKWLEKILGFKKDNVCRNRRGVEFQTMYRML